MTRILTTRRASLLSLAALVLASACGREAPKTLVPEGGYPTIDADRRQMIGKVDSMTVEPTPGGVIVTATGLIIPGFYDIDLVAPPGPRARPEEIRLEFRIRPPKTAIAPGAVPSQQVTAARFISKGDLEGVRTITILAATNSVSRSR